MVISGGVYYAILIALAAERLFELRLSNRNAGSAFARGGIEFGRFQYKLIVALHAAFLATCALGALLVSTFPPTLSIAAIAGEAAAQALRYWSVVALGEKWNTRVIVVPGDEPVTTGPYRYIRHPNYTAVALEIACVPLIRELVTIAAIFSAINALMIAWRIRLEERALGESYTRAFASRPRFIPTIAR